MRYINFVAWGQAIYFFTTGVWPLLNIKSFEAVTSPKTDKWLVKTVALMIVAVSITIGVGVYRGRLSLEIGLLAICCSTFLTIIDVMYSLKGVISKIYLADALPEIFLIFSWLVCWEQWAR